MTISIRISHSEPPIERPVGGLVGAFVGGTQYIQQGSVDVEITADEAAFETAGELAGWVEEIAPVAASTLRHAAFGELLTNSLSGEVVDSGADLRTTTEAEADANAEDAPIDVHNERIQAAREIIRSVLGGWGGIDGVEMLGEKILIELDRNGLVA